MCQIITRRTIFALSLLTFATSQLSLSAKERENLKNWYDGPLTWADYKTAEFPEKNDYSSISSFMYTTKRKKVKIENYKILYYEVSCHLDRNSSWYDPKMANEWDLRANQVIFDIWELYGRQIQFRGLGETTQTFNNTMNRYNELAVKRINEFEKDNNKDSGFDSTVVMKYEESIKSELERTPRREPDLSLAGRVPDMLGFYFSYVHGSFMGKASDYLKPMNGLSYGFDYISKRNWYFDIGLSFQFSNLKKGGFYYDSQYSYDWRTDESTNHFRLYFNVGYAAKLNQYYRIIPYAGISYSGLTQPTGIPDVTKNNNSFYISDINGFSAMAGVNADWIFRHTIFPDENLDTSLRFRLFGAYDSMGGNMNMWSVNFGVAIHLNVKTYNTPMFLYVPIII